MHCFVLYPHRDQPGVNFYINHESLWRCETLYLLAGSIVIINGHLITLHTLYMYMYVCIYIYVDCIVYLNTRFEA